MHPEKKNARYSRMNEQRRQQLRQELAKEWLIVFLIVVGVPIAILIGIRIAYRDRVVLEDEIGNLCTIQVKAKVGWWEICISVYLKIWRAGQATVKSTPIACYSPEKIEAKELNLEIRNVDNIVFLYSIGSPDKILALIALDNELVYPAYGIQEDEYYRKVRNLFCSLKTRLNNNKLVLSRTSGNWYNNCNP